MQNFSEEAEKQLENIKGMKQKAVGCFREKDYNQAVELYFQILHKVRECNEFKGNKKIEEEYEMTARLNIALCKMQLKEYDMVVDQCEMVIDNEDKSHWESGQWKANYRTAQAMYMKTDHCKDGKDIDSVMEYVNKAIKWNNQDAKLKEFHSEILHAWNVHHKNEESPEEKAKWEKRETEKNKKQGNGTKNNALSIGLGIGFVIIIFIYYNFTKK